MKTKVLISFCGLGALTITAAAQAQMPTTPAPRVEAVSTTTDKSLAAQAPAAPVAPAAPTASAAPVVGGSLQPSQVVYVPRLPTAQELTDVGNARGVQVDRIEQSAQQVTVAYKLPDGQTSVVAYVLLGSTTAPVVAPTVAPAPTVIYQTAPRVVYYDYGYAAYDPWIWYPPVAFSVGVGFGHAYHYHHGYGYSHGWGGGWHHGWHR